MSLRYSSWKECLLAKTVSIEGTTGNDNMGAFPAATNKTTIPSDALLANLTEEGSVLLTVLENGEEKKLSIIHQVKNFGGTRTRTSNKVVALKGLAADAKILKIDETSLLTYQNLWAPKEDDLLECESKEDAENCTAIDSAQYRIKVLPVVVCPPLLVALLLKTEERDPMELIHLFNKAASNFDEETGGDVATKAIGYYLRWLWLVGKDKVESLACQWDEEDEETNSYLAALRANNILPPSEGMGSTPPTAEALSVLVPVLSRIGETLDTTNKLHAKTHLDREERESSKKNRTKDFHPSFINMMLNASSENWEVAAESLTDFALSFFNSKTAGLADQTLLRLFQVNNMEDAGFAEGLTRSLYEADWLWPNNTNPKNASFFSFYSNLPESSEQTGRFLVMHLQDSNKVFKSSEDVLKSTKQYIKAPQTYQELLDAINMFTVFLRGFHGEESEPAVKCQTAFKLVSQNPSTFKGRCLHDKNFASAFLYKLDKRYQIFMKDCRDASERDMISQRTMDYEALIENVKMGDFVSFLPSVFSVAGDNKRKPEEDIGTDTRRKNGKRGKGSDDKGRVMNEGFDEKLKLSDEEWKKISGDKELLKLRPKLTDKCFMCHRWTSRGYCFPNCSNVDAHCPSSDEKLTEYKGWLVKARKTAKGGN